MIGGVVTEDLEATVKVVVVGADGRQQQVRALIDTGFSGFLTLTPDVVTTLNLTLLGRETGILADGSEVLFDVYRESVLWNGLPRRVEVNASDAKPLLGMSLLAGHDLTIRVVAGGGVTITPLSAS
jgi:clan AA aspartic protease